MSIFQRHSISLLEIWLVSLVAIFLVIVALLSMHVHNAPHNHHSHVRSKSLSLGTIPISFNLQNNNNPSLEEVLNNVEIEEMRQFVEDHSQRRGMPLSHEEEPPPIGLREEHQVFIPPPLQMKEDAHLLLGPLSVESLPPPQQQKEVQQENRQLPLQPPIITQQQQHAHDKPSMEPEALSQLVTVNLSSKVALLVVMSDNVYVTMTDGRQELLAVGSIVISDFSTGVPMNSIESLQISYPMIGNIPLISSDEKPSRIPLAILEVDNEHGKIQIDDSLRRQLVERGLEVVHNMPHLESSFLLSIHGTSSGQWGEQFPIGNGHFGAFIGGTNQYEVIPVSTSDFYVYNKEALQSSNHGQPIQPEGSKDSDPAPAIDSPLPGLRAGARPGMSAQQGRLLYMQHEEQLKQHIQSSLGYFEYLLDVVMLFDSRDLSEFHSQVKMQNRHPGVGRLNSKQASHPPPQPLAADKLCHRNPMIRNRQTLLCDAQQSLSKKLNKDGETIDSIHMAVDSDLPHKVIFSQSTHLDVKRGITHSYLLEGEMALNEKDSLDSLRLHDREWFVSEEYQVMIGRYHCVILQTVTTDGEKKSCLDWTMFIKRQYRGNQEDPMDLQGLSFTTKWSEEHNLDPYISNHKSVSRKTVPSVAMTAMIKSSSAKLAPTVAICALLFCVDQSSSSTTRFYHGEGNIFHCSDAREGLVMMSVAKSDDLLGRDPESYINDNEDELSKLCWNQLKKANEAGVHQLRENHINVFSDRMSRVEVEIESSSTNEINQHHIQKDIENTNKMFQYGRYLLLSSSSSHSVANLQGLWSEGPISAWNGDYHININMQMIYWSMFSSGIDEATPGFLKFIKKASEKGRDTASVVYGFNNNNVEAIKKGWVMHGFTDSTLRGDLFSDLQWAMCITCGAWLSTHLFEFAAYRSWDTSMILGSILPVLRGSLNFFHRHIWFTSSDSCSPLSMQSKVDDTFMAHTGPTTSPENSMRIKPLNVLSFLTLSPAIDVSVLRELVNAFELLVEWTAQVEDTYLELEQDRSLAKLMKDTIFQLPNHAVPKLFENSGRIMEYPDACATTRVMTPPNTALQELMLDDEFDQGHRHFSLMHWLYPATLHPTLTQKLHQSAVKTMHGKLGHGGGHTAWSSAWAASLWARLADGEQAWKSLRSILSNYTATNMLTLHPPLQPLDGDNCVTCYTERFCPLKKNAPHEVFRMMSPARGFTDLCNDVFQLDGNMGFVAAVVEMLMQSHFPGTIHLLPSLPQAWLNREGTVKQMRIRGDAQVSIYWKQGKVVVAIITFANLHPWWAGTEMDRERDGFYVFASTKPFNARSLSKNKLKLVSVFEGTECSFSASYSTSFEQNIDSNLFSISLQLQQDHPVFPCTVLLCDDELSDERCQDAYKQRLTF